MNDVALLPMTQSTRQNDAISRLLNDQYSDFATALTNDASSELIDSLTWASHQLWCPLTDVHLKKSISREKEIENDDAQLDTTTDTASTSAMTLSMTNTLDKTQERNIASRSSTLSTTTGSEEGLSNSWNHKTSSEALVLLPSKQGKKSDLLSSFHQLANMFACGSLEDDIVHRQTVLKETTKTVDIIRLRMPEATQELVNALFSMLAIQSNLLDVAVESATSIARFLEHRLAPRDRSYVVQKTEQYSSNLISILSTAYLTSVKSSDNRDPMESLLVIAAASKSVQRKMVKRRATTLAIARCLRSSDHWERVGALDFCARVFQDDQSVKNLFSVGDGKNLELIVNGLIKRVRDNMVVQDQLAAISILSTILSLHSHVDDILETFQRVAFESKSRDAVIVAVNAYCSYFEKNAPPSLEQQKALIGFGTLPLKEARRLALFILRSHTNNSCNAQLLENLDTIDSLLSIICHSPAKDGNIGLDIVRQFARSRVHHANLCRHPGFIRTIVSLVKTAEPPNPLATEILIALLLNKENNSAFLQVPDVCQWLTSFVTAYQTEGGVPDQLISLNLLLMLNGQKGA